MANQSKNTIDGDFIPANESKLVILFFKWYVRYLFGKRFRNVWLQRDYNPESRSTLYFLNHHSWWDGITPLLLNEFVLNQKARAIMEDVQIRKFRFFTKIGAMSINRTNIRSAMITLKAASDWLKKENTSLFLYPEGKITNPHDPIRFESGLMRIKKWSPNCDIVPIAMYISHQRDNKPELFIQIGPPCRMETLQDHETALQQLLVQTRTDSLSENHGYTRLI